MSDRRQNFGQTPSDAAAASAGSRQTLRKRAEEQARSREPTSLSAPTPEESQRVLYELRVHQIELEMQNEELRAAQAEIEAGRARYFDLYDLAPVGYCTLSEQGLILEANLTAATLLGTARGALVKQPVSRFIVRDDQDIYYLHRKQLFESGKPREFELRLVKPDGTNFWAQLTATAARAEDGAPLCRLALSDITERKRAEKNLLEMAERYRLANKATNDVVWDWDIVNDAQRWNEAGTAVFGWTDIVEAPQTSAWWMDRVHPEDRSRVDQTFFAAVSDPAADRWNDEYRFRKADGTYAFVVDRGYILRDADGRAVRMIGAMLDLTVRKRAEEALCESERLLSRSQEMAHTGSWKLDLTANRLTWSDEVYRIFGCKPQEFAATYEAFLDFVHPEDRAAVAEAYSRSQREESDSDEIEHRIVRRNSGEVRHVHARCVHARDAAGAIIQSVGMVQDITDRKRADEAARREQVFSEALIDSIPGTFYVLDERGGYVRWNAYQRDEIVGRPEEQTAGFSAIDTIHPGDREMIGARIANVLNNGTVETVEGRVLLHGGPAFRWFLMTGRQMVVDGKTLLVGIGIDITERKRVEEALRGSEARFRSYIEHSPYGVFVVDGQGRYLDVNPAAVRITGYSAGQLTSLRISDLLPPESREAGVRHFQTLVETGASVGDTAFRRADGSVGHWRVSATRLGPDRYLGFVEDVTDRKRAEQALREEHERLENVLTATRTGVDIIDGDFNLHFVDRGWQKVYGDPTGRKCYEYFNGLSAPCPGCGIPQALETKQAVITEEVLPRESNRPIEVHILPFQNAAGQWLVAEVNIDITDRKRAEEKHAKLQAQFLQAQKMESVGRLAGGVAHDFNNLLMGILGYAELCREEVAPEHPIHEWLDEITAEANRSADLVRQLLAFARKQVERPQSVDLNEQIEGMLKMLRRLIGERIELTWSPAAALRLVSADPSHIDQVMANLCVNAADAITGHGRIAIATRNATLDDAACAGLPGMAPGAYVLLTVADTGCGMDADTVSHAFEPFFTTKGVGRGTGLGLATVYGIVNQSRGCIYVASAPGAGTTFSIYLPALEGPETEAAAPLADAGPPPGGSETILVVDDERSIRVTTAAQLQRLGYTVLTADGPETALRLAREHAGAIDLLLSDMVMPGLSGVELRNRLVSDHPSLKTILITGYTTADFVEPEGAGADTVRLTKPVPLRALAIAIRSLLGARRAETGSKP